MLKLIHILPLAMLSLVVGACASKASDEPAPAPPDPVETPQFAMSFSPASYDPESRDAASDAVADKLGGQFAVCAWKTTASGTTEFVMAKDPSGASPYLVDYSPASGWSYTSDPAKNQYLKYWDLSASSYTFYALANYSDFSPVFSGGKCTLSLDSSKAASASILESYYKRDASASLTPIADYDLLAADPSAVYSYPAASEGAPAYADVVPLPFHRLVSQVMFKIYNKSPQSGINISILHAEIKITGSDGFYTTASYTCPDFSYTGGTKETTFVDDDFTDAYIKSSKKNAFTLSSRLVLPQSLSGLKAHVVVTTDIGTLTGTIDLSPGWDRDKIYTYYLYTEYTDNLILVNEVEIDPWTAGASIDKTQTNW